MKDIYRQEKEKGSKKSLLRPTSVENKKKGVEQTFAVMARAFVMATLPHSKPDGLYFQRKNGHYTLTITANKNYGLPYGALARLLLVCLCTIASNLGSQEISLGDSLTTFLKKLSLRNIGGVRGSARRIREQLMRLLTCSISYDYHDKKKDIYENDQFHIGRSFKLWWDASQSDHVDLKLASKIILAKDFYDDLIKHSVPIDFNALTALRRSPLQIDLYIWLTYRFFSLKKNLFIHWGSLIDQFGADYANNAEGIRNFKKKFLQALKKVWMVYPEANVLPKAKGILLSQSNTHIKKK